MALGVLRAPPCSGTPQVYMFLVKWQDLSEKVVYRKFTEIYEFHVSVGGGALPGAAALALWASSLACV